MGVIEENHARAVRQLAYVWWLSNEGRKPTGLVNSVSCKPSAIIRPAPEHTADKRLRMS
jgi:hypothetical protein